MVKYWMRIKEQKIIVFWCEGFERDKLEKKILYRVSFIIVSGYGSFFYFYYD